MEDQVYWYKATMHDNFRIGCKKFWDYHDQNYDKNGDKLLLKYSNMTKEEITKLLDNLSSRERLVLQLRFGLSDGKNRTLEDIGKMLGLTRERIRQIEKKALSKLRGLENIGQLRELIV